MISNASDCRAAQSDQPSSAEYHGSSGDSRFIEEPNGISSLRKVAETLGGRHGSRQPSTIKTGLVSVPFFPGKSGQSSNILLPPTYFWCETAKCRCSLHADALFLRHRVPNVL